MANYKTFGFKKDGTLIVCRARPENRGKGNCSHDEHVQVSKEQLSSGFVQVFNEEVLGEAFGTMKTSKTDNNFPKVSENEIQASAGGKTLSKEELLLGAQKIANRFTEEDWSLMTEFYSTFSKSLQKSMYDSERRRFYNNVSKKVAEYLVSDDPTAVSSRGFLGDEIDIGEFSKILTHQVRAMTAVEEWRSNRSSSLRRVVLTALDNDMTSERYVASVMFFGGRCCYCNCVLRKTPPPSRQASGEHITPVTPENNGIHGGTRYGNMALACVRCNNSRGNEELVSWIQKTNCIPEKDKELALGRIQAFRRFALYHEYTEKENLQIVSTITKLEKDLAILRKDKHELDRDEFEGFKKEIKVALYDLKKSMRESK